MLAYALLIFAIAYAHGLKVNTTEGVVEGSKAADGDYYVFYGIPYAGPTSGQNRFKRPVPPSRYPGVFYANNSNVICAQPTARGLIGIEDCLTLSIFTKNVIMSNISRPVFVWLNTEEYTTTYTQNISFRRFVEENVVFVTINFRVSIFGFLCLGVKEAPGNAGLKDVIQGLKWIKLNIMNFGGDPTNVVLMGHAAGAAMVDLLISSPQSEYLVHKAIALSGSALAPWAVAYDPVGYAEVFGTKIGYNGKTNTDLAKYLVNTNTNIIQNALKDLKFHNHTPIFAPCIENPNFNDSLILEAPLNALRSGKYTQVPYIYGYTTREGTLRVEDTASEKWKGDVQENFSNLLPVDLQFGKNKKVFAESFRDYYFYTNPTIDNYLVYEGDVEVIVPVIRAAKERAMTSDFDVRLLEFGYVGTLNSDWTYNQIPLNGAKHGAFMNYLFDYDLKPIDKAVSRSIVRRFTGYAHDLNPANTRNVNNFVQWAPITTNKTNYLCYVNEDSSVSNTSIFVEKVEFYTYESITFWTNLYAKYYVAPKSLNSSTVTFSCVFFIIITQLLIRLL